MHRQKFKCPDDKIKSSPYYIFTKYDICFFLRSSFCSRVFTKFTQSTNIFGSNNMHPIVVYHRSGRNASILTSISSRNQTTRVFFNHLFSTCTCSGPFVAAYLRNSRKVLSSLIQITCIQLLFTTDQVGIASILTSISSRNQTTRVFLTIYFLHVLVAATFVVC